MNSHAPQGAAFWKVLLEDCLSVLRLTKVAGLDLGEADPEVLPLKAPANKAMQKSGADARKN
jgi:hypothetical protein